MKQLSCLVQYSERSEFGSPPSPLLRGHVLPAVASHTGGLSRSQLAEGKVDVTEHPISLSDVVHCVPNQCNVCVCVTDTVDRVRGPSHGGNGPNNSYSLGRKPLLCLQNVSVRSRLSVFDLLLLLHVHLGDQLCVCAIQCRRGGSVLSVPRLLAICSSNPRLLLPRRRETGAPHHDEGQLVGEMEEHQ